MRIFSSERGLSPFGGGAGGGVPQPGQDSELSYELLGIV